jgi:hypothetical protein
MRSVPHLAAALATLAALAGCGGTAAVTARGEDASVGATGMGDAAGAVDAGSWGIDASVSCLGFVCDASDEPVAYPPCPGTPPQIGASCTNNDQICEYGSSWWLGCNTVLRCTAGTWQKDPLPGSGPCGELDAGGTCPATWAEASALDASTACPALDCQYPEGYCECVSGCGGGGKMRFNSGVTGTWRCLAITAGCPSPRPVLGTACDPPGMFCRYGWSCGCGQELSCTGGLWQGGSTPPCP